MEGILLCSVNVTTKHIHYEIFSDTFKRLSTIEHNTLSSQTSCFYIIHFIPETEECASHPCQHRGTCTDRVNGYTCTCLIGYEGPTCGTGKLHICVKIYTNKTLHHSRIFVWHKLVTFKNVYRNIINTLFAL
jgi:hypothetical protein